MAFRISNSTVQQNNQFISFVEDINDQIETINIASSGSSSSTVRNVVVYDDVGGSTIVYEPNGSVIYSFNQNPPQIVVDDDETPVQVGTEFIIYAGENGATIQSFRTDDTLQISGFEANSSRANIGLNSYCKCTILKITPTLWVLSGDGLSYLS